MDQTNIDVIYINIPPEPNLEDIELNEQQLEVVAGGTIILPPSTWDYINDLINHRPGEDGQ